MALLDHQVKTVKSLHLAGWSYGEIAESFGVTRNTIAGALHRAGVRSGRGNKLHPDQVAEIKRRIREGERQRNIAEAYSINVSMVSHIATGRVWARVA
jgi:transposase